MPQNQNQKCPDRHTSEAQQTIPDVRGPAAQPGKLTSMLLENSLEDYDVLASEAQLETSLCSCF